MSTKITISFRSIISDFLFWGLCLSVILNMFDNTRYYIFQLIFIGIYLFILGINGSLKILVDFIRKHLLLVLAFCAWTILALFQSSIYSSLRILSFFALIFMGYLIVVKNQLQGLVISLRRIGILLFISVLYGLVAFFLKTNPFMFLSERFETYTRSFTRITSVFVHPIPCATFFILALIIILTIGKNKIYTTIASIICLAGIIYTFSRSAWASALIVMLIIYYPKIKKLCVAHKLKKNTLIFLIIAFLGICLLAIIYRNALAETINLVVQRLFKEDLSSDMSFTWRISSIGIIANQSINSGPVGFLFGHGVESGSQFLTRMHFGSLFSYNVGAVDNSYISVLYDLGIVGLGFIIALIIVTAVLMFRFQNRYCKIISYIMIVLLIMAFFYEELYWCNSGYLFFSFAGITIALWDRRKIL